jgi:hypothetical protein
VENIHRLCVAAAVALAIGLANAHTDIGTMNDEGFCTSLKQPWRQTIQQIVYGQM